MSRHLLLVFPALLISYEMATYLSNDMYLPALPQLMADLNLSQSVAQLTLTSWFFGSASMQLILGPLSDKVGRRPILLGGGILFILSSIVCALAQDITTLIVARFIQGTSVCSVIVAGYASIHELFDDKQAMKTLAWMGSVTILAPAFGPLLGAVILVGIFHSWRLIFWILSGTAALSLFLLYHYMPESHPLEKREPVIVKKLLENYFNILITPGFIVPLMMYCFLFGGIMAWLAAGPFLVNTTFKQSVIMFGVYQAVIFMGFIIGTRITRRLLNKFTPKRIIHDGLLCACIGGVGGLLWSYLYPENLYGLIIGLTLFSLGSGICMAPLNRVSIASCEAYPMGTRVALFSCIMSLFGALGSVLASVFYTAGALSLAILIAALSLLAYVLVCVPTHKRSGD